MKPEMSDGKATSKELKGRHVLYWMLAFFGVIFAVNGVFLYQAITSFPGEDVKKSYVQGLQYNQTLAARAAQTELGWRAEAGLDGNIIIFRLADHAGTPISGRPIIAELRRTTSQAEDKVLTFTPREAGEYAAAHDLEPGLWQLRIKVLDHAAQTTVFTAEKRLRVE